MLKSSKWIYSIEFTITILLVTFVLISKHYIWNWFRQLQWNTKPFPATLISVCSGPGSD